MKPFTWAEENIDRDYSDVTFMFYVSTLHIMRGCSISKNFLAPYILTIYLNAEKMVAVYTKPLLSYARRQWK